LADVWRKIRKDSIAPIEFDIGAPPEELAGLIARALVCTFLGILLAYGFVVPLAEVDMLVINNQELPHRRH
jgi:hypothetical protein